MNRPKSSKRDRKRDALESRNALVRNDYTVPAPHYAHPFNPDIANPFFRSGEIEAWGRGIARIFEACRREGAPEPEVRFEANGMWIEFPFDPDVLEAARAALAETPVETLVETPVRTPDAIVEILRQKPSMTLAEIAEALSMSTSAIERAARKLCEKGRIRYVGPQKGGHWEVML